MKNLKHKSEFQEEEMQKLKKKIHEAGSLAAEKSSKCTVAFNAMKGIRKQVISQVYVSSLSFTIMFKNSVYLHVSLFGFLAKRSSREVPFGKGSPEIH